MALSAIAFARHAAQAACTSLPTSISHGSGFSTGLSGRQEARAAWSGNAIATHAGQAVGTGVPYYAGVAMAGAHLAWQVAAVDLDSQSDCLAKFGSNKWYGALLFGGAVLDKLAA